jgi:F-type H+-transporting ATPase subunit alpha
LKQGQYSPVPVEKQVCILFAGGNGYIDDVAVEDVRRFESEFSHYLDNNKADILTAIREEKQISDKTKDALKAALTEFKGRFQSGKKKA